MILCVQENKTTQVLDTEKENLIHFIVPEIQMAGLVQDLFGPQP